MTQPRLDQHLNGCCVGIPPMTQDMSRWKPEPLATRYGRELGETVDV